MAWHDVLDQIDWLRGTPYQVEELTGGLTNVNLKVTHPGGVCVVRVAQPGSELLAIDRATSTTTRSPLPRPASALRSSTTCPDAGLMVVGYLDGRTFTNADLRSGEHVDRVAAAVRQLHEGPRFEGDFDMFALQPAYLKIVTERGFRLPDRYLDFAPQVGADPARLRRREEPTVPCNNDLLAGNLIDDGEKSG